MAYNILGAMGTLEMGEAAITDNACCIATLDNIVMLMGSVYLIGYTAGNTICTLPEEMRPRFGTRVPVCLNMDIVPLVVTASGELFIESDSEMGVLFLNGVVFNVCDSFYNDEIGNNFPQGTSPLR